MTCTNTRSSLADDPICTKTFTEGNIQVQDGKKTRQAKHTNGRSHAISQLITPNEHQKFENDFIFVCDKSIGCMNWTIYLHFIAKVSREASECVAGSGHV